MLNPALDRLRPEADVPVAHTDDGQVAAAHKRVDQRPRNAEDGGNVGSGQ
jgi:hypothetical protein